jgi:hypothetical protein
MWRSRTEIVLWPLSYTFRHWQFPQHDLAPWEQREPRLLWRGQPSGMSYMLEAQARPILTGIRGYRRWLMYFLMAEAAADDEAYHLWAPTYQRLLAVDICRDIPATDVRFVPMWDGNTTPLDVAARYLGNGILAERVDHDELWAARQACKYLLCLAGNDWPSSLRTDLLSGCLVLMPRPFWENTWFFGLTPNVHYIPLRADLADLEERLDWCRDNDAQCREMAAAARAFALEHLEPALEFEVQRRLTDRLVEQVSLGAVL